MNVMRWEGREYCHWLRIMGMGRDGSCSAHQWMGVLMNSVLHLAASTCTQQSYTFFSILLKNAHILVNAQDSESGYTALHRALCSGNLRAARDLLARPDCDTAIRDAEGMTAFELYNGTVDGVGSSSSYRCLWDMLTCTDQSSS